MSDGVVGVLFVVALFGVVFAASTLRDKVREKADKARERRRRP